VRETDSPVCFIQTQGDNQRVLTNHWKGAREVSMPKAGRVTTAIPVATTLLLALVTPRAGRAAEGADPVRDPDFPSIGARVRVTSSALPSGRAVGTLNGIDGVDLAFRPGNQAEVVVLETHTVSRLEWSVRPSRKKTGALIGLGVGFGVGFAGTFILCGAFGDECPAGEGVVFGSLYGLATGALGAVVGGLVSPGEHWTEVPLNGIPSGSNAASHGRVHLSVVPIVGTRRGLRLVASL
jgi:hypothetical protein